MLSNEPEPSTAGGTEAPRRRGDRTGTGDSGDAGTQREYVGAGLIGGVVLLLVLGVLLVALIAQNAETVPFELLWFSADVSLAALLLGVAVGSILVAELVGVLWRRRRRKYRTIKESSTS